jgi:predicted PurR-regulated permease PerM
MTLGICLVLYALLFLILFLLLLKLGKDTTSSFMISVVVSFVFLVLVFPPQWVRVDRENTACTVVYSFIFLLSIIITMIYSLVTPLMTPLVHEASYERVVNEVTGFGNLCMNNVLSTVV